MFLNGDFLCTSVGYKPRSRITQSWDMHIFSFSELCPEVFRTGYASLLPLHPAVYQVSAPTSLSVFGAFCLLYFSLSGGYDVVSPCSFNLDFPED